MSEKHVYIKTFLKKDDADEYLDKLIESHKDLTIMEADVKYINGGWRVGATFGDGQLELKLVGTQDQAELPPSTWSEIYQEAIKRKIPDPYTRRNWLLKGVDDN